MRFHSLQTGARISTLDKDYRDVWNDLVSIPFKRERASQQRSPPTNAESRLRVSIPFKRDSASQLNANNKMESKMTINVSIPFKRDSATQRF